MIEEIIYVSDKTFVKNKEQFCRRKFSIYWNSATGSGTCYRFRNLLQIKALATGSIFQKCRSSSVFEKFEVVFHFEKLRLSSI